MNLEDLIKLAGLQKDDTPAVEPVEVEQQVAETPFDGRDNMKAMIALVSPEQLNQLVGDAPIEEEGFGNSGNEYAGEPEEYKGTLGSPADLSLRRYLGANGEHVTVDETKVYEDHKVEDISEAYFNYKLDEAPKSAWVNLPNNPNSLELPRDPKDLQKPAPGLENPIPPGGFPPRPRIELPMPDPRYPEDPNWPMPEPGPPNDPTPFPDPMPEPGPPNDPTPFPGPPNDPTPFPDPEPDPPGEPIPEPKPEPGPKPPTPGGGPEEPPKDPGFDPDPDFPDEPEKPKDPVDTKIDPKDLDGDSPAEPKDPNWDLRLDALGRNIQTAKEREAMFQKHGLTPPRDVLKAQLKREQDRRDRMNKVGFDKLYNDRDQDTLNGVMQRDENGNLVDPDPKESTMNEEPNEGNEFTGALANAKKAGKKEFKVDGKTYQVEAVEQLHADMNRMRKLSGLAESTIMERPGLENKRGYDPFGSQEPPANLQNKRGFDPFGSQEPPASLQNKRGFDPFGSAPGDEGDEPEDPMGGMGEPGGPADPPAGTRPPDAIGPKPTPSDSDPEFDPFGGAPGDEGEDPMGGMGEPSGPADPPAGTRPPDAIGPKPTPTPPASGTRPPDAIGPKPTPTPPASGTRPPDAIGPKDPATPATPGDKAGVTAKPKAPTVTPEMRADAEAYADREGLPLDQLGTLVSGTVGGIPTTLEVGKDGTVTDMKTGDIIGGDDADAARGKSKGRSAGLGAKPEAPATPGDRAGVTAKSDSGEQTLPNGMTVAQAKRLAKLAGYTDEQIAAYEKRAKEQGLIK
jgi:hypothetical protein